MPDVMLTNPQRRKKDDAPLPPVQVPTSALQRAAQRVRKLDTSFIRPPSAFGPADALAVSHGASFADVARSGPRPQTRLPYSMSDDTVRIINGLGMSPTQQDARAIDNAPPIKLVAPQRVHAGVNAEPAFEGGSSPALRRPTGDIQSGAEGSSIAGGGRIINGVPTFSDGNGSIPQTITPAQVRAKAGNFSDTRVASAPGLVIRNPTAATSGAAGGSTAPVNASPSVSTAAPTSTLRNPTSSAPIAAAAQFAPASQAPAPATSTALRNPNARTQFNTGPQLSPYEVQNDLASIAMGDNSVLGNAASALRERAQYGTPRERRMAEQELTQLQQGVMRMGGINAQQQGATSRTSMQERGAGNRAAMAQTGANQRAVINRPDGQIETLNDGRMLVVNPRTAQSTLVRTPDGRPATAARTKRVQQDNPEYFKAMQTLTQQLVGLNANNQIADANAPGGFRAPTAADWARAQSQARVLVDKRFGRETPRAIWTQMARNANPKATAQQIDQQWQQYHRSFQS